MTRIILHLDSMAYGGEAVGRHEGKTVFVTGGIAGEDVVVEVTEDKARFARARVVEVLTPSPDRVAPPCTDYGRCGGCQWQHIAYPAQLRFKQEIVRMQLERVGKIADAPVQPTLGMAEPWRYRNNMQFVLDREGKLCLLAARSDRPVPIKDCRLLCPELNEVFAELEMAFPGLKGITLRAGRCTGEQMLVLETEGGEQPEIEVDRPLSCVLTTPEGEELTLIGSPRLNEELGGRRYCYSASSFFQVNTAQAEQLVRLVREYAAVQPGDMVLDAYGGVGVFALTLAERAAQVFLIEANPRAVADAEQNAQGLNNVEIIEGTVEEVLPQLEAHIDVAVVDPPRAGVDKAALAALVERQPRRIVYVSCDPTTLARDLRELLDHGYRLDVVRPVDMFPQTYHVECVALVSRAE